jgi:acyl dehydratase
MSTRVFSAADQEHFAALTGDWNQLHVDPVAARRTQFGRPLVHGVHLLLWALEESLYVDRQAMIETLSCTFRRPVGVGEPAECHASSENGAVRLRVTSRGAVSLSAELTLAASREMPFADAAPVRQACKLLAPEAAADARGVTALRMSPAAWSAAFPRLEKFLPPAQLALLAASTRIVGMECPGLHSVYTALEIAPATAAPHGVEWAVQDYDERFARVTIEARSAAGNAIITAAFRPPPQPQPNMSALATAVAPTAYAGRRALVAGGSRGLGELCAKMLAAGGAQVWLTYHHGSEDAGRVAAEILAAGGAAQAVSYNVLAPPPNLVSWFAADAPPTHVYYFATPPITAGAPGGFSPETFQNFCRYYVEGVKNLWSAIRAFSKHQLTLVYPSSVYVEDMVSSLGEYAVAKAAGEALCRFIAAVDRLTTTKTPRLPRLPTDQTLSLTEDEPEDDAVMVMKALLED